MLSTIYFYVIFLSILLSIIDSKDNGISVPLAYKKKVCMVAVLFLVDSMTQSKHKKKR